MGRILIYQPAFRYTPSILRLIEEVARLDGELRGLEYSISTAADLDFLAQADATHFSTKLEGNPLTYRQVTDALRGKLKGKGRDLREVLNYARTRRTLLQVGVQRKPLREALILETHRGLMTGIVTEKLKGHYRESQNAIRDSKSGGLVYLPPTADDVPDLMTGLLRWVDRSMEENATLVAAIFHYRFVTIHPFLDGNGRSARLLTNYILISRGYEVMKTAAIEKQHESNRPLYYRELRKLQAPNFYEIPDNIDLSAWIEYWLTCLKSTYSEALSRIRNIDRTDLPTGTPDRLETALRILRQHKVLKASEYQGLTGLGRTQAVADLNTLVDAGRLRKKGGGRSVRYELP